MTNKILNLGQWALNQMEAKGWDMSDTLGRPVNIEVDYDPNRTHNGFSFEAEGTLAWASDFNRMLRTLVVGEDIKAYPAEVNTDERYRVTFSDDGIRFYWIEDTHYLEAS